MNIPTEAELVEMERRALRLIEIAAAERTKAAKLWAKAQSTNDAYTARESELNAELLEKWADAQERCESDFSRLAALVRELRPMPVSMLPQRGDNWPEHLPSPGGGLPFLDSHPANWRPTKRAMRRELRMRRDPQEILPWQERRRIYLERKGRAE